MRGWDPVKKQEIVGKARQDAIGLSRAASQIAPPASILDLGFLETLQSATAAHGVAKAVLSASTEQDLSAEMAVDGDAALRARAEIILQGAGDAFNGNLVQGACLHRYHRGPGGSWKTLLRVLREDRSVISPEVTPVVTVRATGRRGDDAVAMRKVTTTRGDGAPPRPDLCRGRAAQARQVPGLVL